MIKVDDLMYSKIIGESKNGIVKSFEYPKRVIAYLYENNIRKGCVVKYDYYNYEIIVFDTDEFLKEYKQYKEDITDISIYDLIFENYEKIKILNKKYNLKKGAFI